jgi:hypothetical protein
MSSASPVFNLLEKSEQRKQWLIKFKYLYATLITSLVFLSTSVDLHASTKHVRLMIYLQALRFQVHIIKNKKE